MFTVHSDSLFLFQVKMTAKVHCTYYPFTSYIHGAMYGAS